MAPKAAKSKAPRPKAQKRDETADPLAFRFFNEIGIIEQLARNRFERVLPDGLRLPHFTVLNHLVRLGDGRSPLQLARSFQLTKSTITNTLQRLEARGLIRVEPDPADGRGKLVFLTPAGRRLRQRSIAALAPALAEVEGLLGSEAMARALPTLQKVRAYLDAERDRPRKG